MGDNLFQMKIRMLQKFNRRWKAAQSAERREYRQLLDIDISGSDRRLLGDIWPEHEVPAFAFFKEYPAYPLGKSQP